ncbi:MAG TPA: hypothetical protein VFR07_03765 [Mycobacteriales bacterium]|jgi:hypothetical protein|nr:hypothetical protein [Mycobacteriales bacterium]
MSPEKLGSLIGAGFGLVFVLVNSGSLPTTVAVAVRVLAVAAFLVVLVAVRRPTPAGGSDTPTGGFGRPYWLVVAGEVLLIWVGLALLNAPLDTPDAAVAWISCVVGAHFLALAVVWRNRLFHWLGGAMLACGLVGLVLAARGADVGAIKLVSGILPGAILLGFALWGSRTRTGPQDAPAGPRQSPLPAQHPRVER